MCIYECTHIYAEWKQIQSWVSFCLSQTKFHSDYHNILAGSHLISVVCTNELIDIKYTCAHAYIVYIWICTRALAPKAKLYFKIMSIFEWQHSCICTWLKNGRQGGTCSSIFFMCIHWKKTHNTYKYNKIQWIKHRLKAAS